MKKIGFIDYYLDEWHANSYPRLIKEKSGGAMEVGLAWALMDSPLPGGRTSAEWSRDLGIPLAPSMQALIADCDALVVLSPDNCEMHEQLCALALASGKPTYVDKTFAPDLETAQRIFAVADAAGTPCYSTSALRFAREYRGIEDVMAISAWGAGRFETYAIHQLEPIMMLMGGSAKRIMALPFGGGETILIEFEDGRTANVNCFGFEGEVPFMAQVRTATSNVTVKVESDYFSAFIVELVRFFETGNVPVPQEQTLLIMAVRGAGVKALRVPGTWVDV